MEFLANCQSGDFAARWNMMLLRRLAFVAFVSVITSHPAVARETRPEWMAQAVWQSVFGATTPSGQRLSAAQAAPLVLSAKWPPTYPTRVGWHLEIGVFLLSVRPDGMVSNVEMLHTTGQKFLDRQTISAFMQWRFRPNSVKEVRVPAHYVRHRL